ncbi:hypothetical protein PRIPAC_93356, partial [Pristionchus pacificus]
DKTESRRSEDEREKTTMGVHYKRIDDFFRLDPYQLILQLFNLLAIFTMLSNVVFNVFAAAPPIIEGCSQSPFRFNGTISERCVLWKEYNYCEQPDIHFQFKSVNVEFHSYCGVQEKTWLDTVLQYIGVSDKAKFSTTLQMLGVMFSCLYAGQLSDMYGRRKTLLIAYSAMFILQVLSSFSPSLDIFIISRFLLGLFTGCTLTLTPVFIVECLPPVHRFWICTVVTWAPNYLLFSLAAYLTSEWRSLARVSAAVNLMAIIILLLLEESPKFLIQKKRVEDAIKTITKVNRFSRDKASPSTIREIVLHECGGDENIALLEKGVEEEIKKKGKSKKTYTFYHLYSTRKFAIRTVVVSLSSFILSLITYSLMFNMNSIGGSTYMNMVFSGVLRWTVGATVACLDHFGKNHIGRIRLHIITFGFVTLCLAINFVIFILGMNHEMEMVIRSLALLSFGVTGCLFLQSSLSISELFPTAIRSLASSHSNVVGRLGNVMSPLVFGLDYFPGLPYLILAILGVIDVILYFISIPETKGCPLPNEMPTNKNKLVLSNL